MVKNIMGFYAYKNMHNEPFSCVQFYCKDAFADIVYRRPLIYDMHNCCKKAQDSKQIKDLAQILKIISEPNRLKILCLLKSGTKCVCEIEEALDLKQNLVSHHLKVLKESGLIDYKKHGQWKHYSLKNSEIKKCKEIFNNLLT